MRRIFYLAVVCLIAVLILAETAVAHETSRKPGTTVAPGGVVTGVTGGFAAPLARTPTREVTVFSPGEEVTGGVRTLRITVVTDAPGEEGPEFTDAPPVIPEFTDAPPVIFFDLDPVFLRINPRRPPLPPLPPLPPRVIFFDLDPVFLRINPRRPPLPPLPPRMIFDDLRVIIDAPDVTARRVNPR